MRWQTVKAQKMKMGGVDGQELERLCSDGADDFLQIGNQLADPYFDLDLPQRCHRHEDVVRRICDQVPSARPETRVVREPSQQRMCIEK